MNEQPDTAEPTRPSLQERWNRYLQRLGPPRHTSAGRGASPAELDAIAREVIEASSYTSAGLPIGALNVSLVGYAVAELAGQAEELMWDLMCQEGGPEPSHVQRGSEKSRLLRLRLERLLDLLEAIDSHVSRDPGDGDEYAPQSSLSLERIRRYQRRKREANRPLEEKVEREHGPQSMYTRDDYPREGCTACIDVLAHGYALLIWSPNGHLLESYPATSTRLGALRQLDDWLQGFIPRPKFVADRD